MDPNANIAEQIVLAENIIDLNNHEMSDEQRRVAEDDGLALAEQVLALNGWRKRGGFDPYAAAQVTPDLREALLAVVDARSHIEEDFLPEAECYVDALEWALKKALRSLGVGMPEPEGDDDDE